MQELNERLRRKLWELVLTLRSTDVHHLSVEVVNGIVWADGRRIKFGELSPCQHPHGWQQWGNQEVCTFCMLTREVRTMPDPKNETGLFSEGVYLVLYHHRDPVTSPSFVARTVYRPTLKAAQDAVLENFSHDRTIAAARVYELRAGELRKVADASRAPHWTYY